MIEFGIDRLLLSSPEWKKMRIGLLTNYAATTSLGISSRLALLTKKFNITTLFSPEHGLDAKGEDGKAMLNSRDQITGLPIISLYGKKLAPGAKDLENIDIMLFDVPDIGSRFYTYLWTLTHLMEACATLKKQLIVLDRPNPISGDLSLAEGPMMDESVASFIGRWPIPIRHSCTLGELASYFNNKRNLNCSLEVIKCRNWERTGFQPDWGTIFVGTSPAIQSFESMILYPGLCLLEATNISEGRGTDKAFTIAGAPWINGNTLAGVFNQLGLDEVTATPFSFTPVSGKYKGQYCEGVQFHVKQHAYFQSVINGLLLINLIKSLYPQNFKWAPYPTEVNPTGTKHLDKLLGVPNSEDLFELPLHQFIASITKLTAAGGWKTEMEPYLLY